MFGAGVPVTSTQFTASSETNDFVPGFDFNAAMYAARLGLDPTSLLYFDVDGYGGTDLVGTIDTLSVNGGIATPLSSTLWLFLSGRLLGKSRSSKKRTNDVVS